MLRPLHRSILLAFLALVGVTLGYRPQAQARLLTWTLSGSMGYGYEFHPRHGTQATNLMLTGGLGFIRDYVRLELGVVGAYGAVLAHDREHINLEFRPMVRVTPPLVPLYGRVLFAGLHPFDRTRAVGFGWALGAYIPISRLAPFAEVGFLPRIVSGQVHWIVEGRAGLGVRL